MAEPGKRTTYQTLGQALTARGCGSDDRQTISRVVDLIAEHAGSPRSFYVGEKDSVVGVFFGNDSTVGLYALKTHLDVASDALTAVGGIAGMAKLYPGFLSAPGDRSGRVARLQLAGYRGGAPRASTPRASTPRPGAPRASAATTVRKAVCCNLSQSVGHRCFTCDEVVQAS